MSAAEKPAIIIPTMMSEPVEFNFEAKKTISNKAKNAPTKEAIQISQELFNQAVIPNADDKKITIATPNPAAEVIPKTDGSANGFRNNSCNNNPLIGNEIPAKTAAKVLGNL